MLDFVTKRNWFFLLSGLIILAGLIALGVSGLNLGLEFDSGTTMTLVFEEDVEQADLRTAVADLGHPNAIIQRSDQDAFLASGLALSSSEKDQLITDLQSRFDTTIRIAQFGALGNATAGNETSGNVTLVFMFGKTIAPQDLTNELDTLGYTGLSIDPATLDLFYVRTEPISTTEQGQMKQALDEEFGSVDYLNFATISPEVSGQRVKYNVIGIVVAAIVIMLYIAWAFRKLPRPFLYGACAILALIHDVLIMLAVFAIFNIQVDSMFIIAILTIIGFGVNNVIVVFDRLRESKAAESRFDLATRLNMGITETITRSVNTSLTVLFALLALYAFGGSTIRDFILALIVGVIASTYSSLFIAGQMAVSWENGDFGKLFRWLPIRRKQQG